MSVFFIGLQRGRSGKEEEEKQEEEEEKEEKKVGLVKCYCVFLSSGGAARAAGKLQAPDQSAVSECTAT